jgi:PHD/YefM family antitoxin component YafN of YafNO toxin-antitoxin module
MLTVHPQYIKDANGNKSLVVLPADEFDTLMEALDDAEDIRLYDEAKSQNTGELIPAQDAFSQIEQSRKASV